jgi:ubiquinone/menaquinone biosynthesis C-methylase UbiE
MSDQYRERKVQIAGLFSQVSPEFDQIGPPVFGSFGRRLVELADIQPGAQVLDVAAGTGATLFPAAESVGPSGRVTGIDLSAETVAQTRRRIEELAGDKNFPAEMHDMDAERLTFPDASFDYVICSFALYLFPQRERALDEFRRVLKPGGQIAVSTRRRGSRGFMAWLDEAVGDRMHSRMSQEPVGVETQAERPALDAPKGLEAALQLAGFSDVQVAEEAHDFVYNGAEEVWQWLGTHGARAAIEKLDRQEMVEFQAEFDDQVKANQQADGVHIIQEVLFGLGTQK